ncbi:MAG: hypothetical protein R6W97_01045 [Thiobacillus sp.]
MHRLRLFFFVLLAMAIPLQGAAHAAMAAAHCPVAPMTMTMTDAADMSAAHDCCDDADMGGSSGHSCKPGKPCHPAGHFFSIALHEALPVLATSSCHFPRIAGASFTFEPSATWRPPAQS